jgi:hypothetical protein
LFAWGTIVVNYFRYRHRYPERRVQPAFKLSVGRMAPWVVLGFSPSSIGALLYGEDTRAAVIAAPVSFGPLAFACTVRKRRLARERRPIPRRIPVTVHPLDDKSIAWAVQLKATAALPGRESGKVVRWPLQMRRREITRSPRHSRPWPETGGPPAGALGDQKTGCEIEVAHERVIEGMTALFEEEVSRPAPASRVRKSTSRQRKRLPNPTSRIPRRRLDRAHRRPREGTALELESFDLALNKLLSKRSCGIGPVTDELV